jgi:hypothetical protein
MSVAEGLLAEQLPLPPSLPACCLVHCHDRGARLTVVTVPVYADFTGEGLVDGYGCTTVVPW